MGLFVPALASFFIACTYPRCSKAVDIPKKIAPITVSKKSKLLYWKRQNEIEIDKMAVAVSD